MPGERLRIEVACAMPQRAIVKTLELAAPASVADALNAAAADPDFAGIDFAGSPVGVFGVSVARDQPLATGDRVEVYRALTVDPKAARRERVQRARRGR
jgi:uncharacterized protein